MVDELTKPAEQDNKPVQQIVVDDPNKTGEWYRISFFQKRAEMAMKLAYQNFNNTLDGNPLFPLEAYEEGANTAGDELSSHKVGFAKASKLDGGFRVQVLQDGKPFADVLRDHPEVDRIIDKKELNRWAIEFTAPDNFHRIDLIPHLEQLFGKELPHDKNLLSRHPNGKEEGVLLGKMTLNLEALMSAPNRVRVIFQDGSSGTMATQEQLKKAKAQVRVGRGG